MEIIMNLNNTKLWSWDCLNSCCFAAPLPGSLNFRTCNFVPQFLSHPITLTIPRGHLCSPEKRSSPAFPTKQLFSFLFLCLQLKYLTFLFPLLTYSLTLSAKCVNIYFIQKFTQISLCLFRREIHIKCVDLMDSRVVRIHLIILFYWVLPTF